MDNRAALDQLFTVPEAAEQLRTTEQHVRRLMSRRELGFTYVGRLVRLPASSIAAYRAAHTVEPVK